MKKYINYTNVGSLLIVIFLLGNNANMPEFIKGLCVGLGVTFIFIGYSKNHYILKFRSFKKDMLKRVKLK